MAKTIRELTEEIGAKRAAIAAEFDAATVNGELKMSRDKVDELRQKNAELADLGAELDALRAADEMRRALHADAGEKSASGYRAPEAKGDRPRTVAEMIDGSKELARFRQVKAGTAQIELSEEEFKTLITLTDMTPQADRSATIPSAQPYEPISDLFMQSTTDRSSLEFYAETTFTNNAAARAEGNAFAESALSWTLQTAAIRSVGTWIPLTEEALMDNAEMESTIRNRIAFMVPKARDAALLNGDGIAPNIKGILSYSGIQTQAKSTDPVFDAVMKAITKVRYTGDAEPTAAIFHPKDWEDLVLTRTADGIYILGNPGDPQANKRLWGLAVRVVPAMTENTALVGAFRPYGEFVRRKGLTIAVSTEHSDYWVKNKIAIKGDERVGLKVYRETAFCTVTGI